MDTLVKIIFIPLATVIVFTVATTSLTMAGVDIGDWFATEKSHALIKICDERRVPRPEKSTIWGPVSTGSDIELYNCRMRELNR